MEVLLLLLLLLLVKMKVLLLLLLVEIRRVHFLRGERSGWNDAMKMMLAFFGFLFVWDFRNFLTTSSFIHHHQS